MTLIGNYHYKVMFFGLKNAGSTYQRMMTRMFEPQLGKSIKIYINSPLPTLLLYYYSIGQPLRVEDLFNSPCFFELRNFIPNNVGMFFLRALGWLLFGNDGWVNV